MDHRRSFVYYGFQAIGSSGDQEYGNCVFCDNEKHFYLHPGEGLWDCKICGERGNLYTWWKKLAGLFARELAYRPKRLERLALNRQLPVEAFYDSGYGYQLGWNPWKKEYTIPVRNAKGTYVDIRRWKIGDKAKSSPGGKAELWGASSIEHGANTVWICEGEWDRIALRYLFKECGHLANVVSVPGANTFKQDWVNMFRGKHVILAYDHDDAGRAGRDRAIGLLTGGTGPAVGASGGGLKSLQTVEWPNDLVAGSDVRDWIVDRTTGGGLESRMAGLLRLLRGVSGKGSKTEKAVGGKSPDSQAIGTKVASDQLAPISRKGFVRAFTRWLSFGHDDHFAIVYGALFANMFWEQQVWLFLVGPTGGGKSEILLSTKGSDVTHHVSSLTGSSLVSGYRIPGNGNIDPGIFSMINRKVLVIKDFTVILSSSAEVKEAIFRQLRDAYDGTCTFTFGNGLVRNYPDLKFGLIAGVTPMIDLYGHDQRQLGDRFLYYRMEDSTEMTTAIRKERIQTALVNTEYVEQMKEELTKAGSRLLSRELMSVVIPAVVQTEIIDLADMYAQLGGFVPRDIYRSGLQPGLPMRGQATRFAQQLVQLLKGLCVYYGHSEPTEVEMRLVNKVAWDTLPSRLVFVLRCIRSFLREKKGVFTTTEMAKSLHGVLSYETIRHVMQDLAFLKLVSTIDKRNKGNEKPWKPGKRLRRYLERS